MVASCVISETFWGLIIFSFGYIWWKIEHRSKKKYDSAAAAEDVIGTASALFGGAAIHRSRIIPWIMIYLGIAVTIIGFLNLTISGTY